MFQFVTRSIARLIVTVIHSLILFRSLRLCPPSRRQTCRSRVFWSMCLLVAYGGCGRFLLNFTNRLT